MRERNKSVENTGYFEKLSEKSTRFIESRKVFKDKRERNGQYAKKPTPRMNKGKLKEEENFKITLC